MNPPARFSGKQVLAFVGSAVLVTAMVTGWWINQYLYAATFQPTKLSVSDQQVLDSKMAMLHKQADRDVLSGDSLQSPQNTPLEPEPYTEQESDREIQLTERELNALIAKDREVAQYVAVDLADDLVSVKLLVPVDQEVPILGGKTIKLNFGVMLSYANGKPIVAMRGISLGGIPLPSAWWGDIKNTNLVEEFGEAGGFWDQFAKGVKDIKIRNGQLRVKLKE